ncbi:MAG: DUF362 domain-containing protein [Peptostreptococcales bacterium]
MGKKSAVVLLQCSQYDVREIQEKIKYGIEALGGIETIIGKEETVLLKPNLLIASDASQAVTTHPAVFEALIQCIRKYTKNITYGDSPGIGSPESTAHRCGIKQVADRYKVELSNFKDGKTVTYEKGNITKQFEIASGVLEADAIISISKMKTHQLTRITGAIKNQYGCIYGFNKPAGHVKFSTALDFSKMLVDLNLYLKPRLYIMDGIIAMEGNGPKSGTPIPMNCILMSKDPVALDSVFCRLIDLNPEFIPTITFGEQYGLGRWRDEDIDILGEDIRGLINKNFHVLRKPVITENFNFASKARHIALRKPIIENEKCIGCGVCVDVCPVEGKALNFTKQDKKRQPPQYDYKKCIRCYCCQEMCPEGAIRVKTPLLGKILLYREREKRDGEI